MLHGSKRTTDFGRDTLLAQHVSAGTEMTGRHFVLSLQNGCKELSLFTTLKWAAQQKIIFFHALDNLQCYSFLLI
jgi:hypothetical protein